MNHNDTTQAQVGQQVAHEEVSRRAAELWRQYGSPQGRDDEIWFEAEQQLRGTASALSSPVSEGMGSPTTSPSASASRPGDSTPARTTELMEPKKSPSSKGSRSKNKPGGR